MSEVKIKLEGMSCQHCVMRVKKALDALRGISRADVTVGEATIAFDDSIIKKEDITAAIEKAGYKVVG